MADQAGSSGTSTSGSSGNNMEGNGGRTHDPQAMDRDKAGDRWQDRRQDQRQQKDDMNPTSGNSASTGTSTGATGAAAAQRMPGGAQGDTQLSWRGTVLAIEPLSRQEAQTGIGLSGAPGAAAVGGVVPGTGAAMGTVYRVTLRTEDGGSQAVLVEAAPSYRVGDSVTYSNGVIQRR
ncbi:hypothetical protein [Pseudoduganella chitinolytica]|uniref:Uncharacterized protein n=1 Tax=Pseudoduganella chitinolytica TaxID=34070 RepID=A0ABY8B3Y4_9BURK|nr:hypothetical protein [Pseudoduganella chitinolytica]WEF30662.1 hypothetical protein PX653_14360 [Pseudoduganella chitinolytica]